MNWRWIALQPTQFLGGVTTSRSHFPSATTQGESWNIFCFCWETSPKGTVHWLLGFSVLTLQINSSIAKKAPVPAQPWSAWSENPRDEGAARSSGMKNHACHCPPPGGDQPAPRLPHRAVGSSWDHLQQKTSVWHFRVPTKSSPWCHQLDGKTWPQSRQETHSILCLKHNTSFNA